MNYRSFLKWDNQTRTALPGAPDDRSGDVYLEDPLLRLAAETAIVTQRPLLLRGEPGCGKSSFAPFAARNLNWRYYEATVTGRTKAKDLLWQFDGLARLRDAQAQEKDVAAARYVTPGILWWAFNPDDARDFSGRAAAKVGKKSTLAPPEEPSRALNEQRDSERAVVLIDELDKADPDVPNDLLEVFGLHRFRVDDAQHAVERKFPKPSADEQSPAHFGSLLCVITTNNERDLPAAFLRRCVVYRFEEPTDRATQIERWVQIAQLHAKDEIGQRAGNPALVRSVAVKCCELREQTRKSQRRGPSTAEFLDAVRVCLRLDVNPNSPDTQWWSQVERSVLLKDESNKAGRRSDE